MMKITLLVLLCFVSFCWVLSLTDQLSKQDILNTVISECIVLNAELFQASHRMSSNSPSHDEGGSDVSTLCSNLDPNDTNRKRLSCCQSNKMRVLHNVRLRNNQFEMIYNNNNLVSESKLPPLNAMRAQRVVPLNDIRATVKPRTSKDMEQCKRYFNGTLHIATDRTFHKLYHAVGDNYAPLVAQVLLDAVLDSSFLYLPRMKLNFFSKSSLKPSSHMRLINFLFSAGSKSANELNGWCFRRVVWGPGPYVFYNDQRVALRRAVADFARLQAKYEYNMEHSIPNEFSVLSFSYPAFANTYRSNNERPDGPFQRPVHQNIQHLKTGPLSRGQRRLSSKMRKYIGNEENMTNLMPSPSRIGNERGVPLRIVLYSRGNDSTRSLKLEGNLMRAIGKEFKAYTAICCDFSRVTVSQQISYAYHADIIIGLHGAALVHGIFARKEIVMVEFKMQYAYTSVLFPVISDSRVGVHALLDSREYFHVKGQVIPPGTRIPDGRVDGRLINRTIAVLKYLQFSEIKPGVIVRNDPQKYPNDLIFGPIEMNVNDSLYHLLGPLMTRDITRACHSLTLSKVRATIFLSQRKENKDKISGLMESSDKIHCPLCYDE